VMLIISFLPSEELNIPLIVSLIFLVNKLSFSQE